MATSRSLIDEKKKLKKSKLMNILKGNLRILFIWSNSSKSDIQLLRDAGFTIDAKKKNPRVQDRVFLSYCEEFDTTYAGPLIVDYI